MGPGTRISCALAAASLAFVVAASAVGCGGRKLQEDAGTGILTGIGGVDGGGGPGGSAAGGGTDPARDPCAGPSDPRLVIAPQRTVLLTSTQLVNMVRTLVGNDEATAIVNEAVFYVVSDVQRRFPPSRAEPIRRIVDSDTMLPFTLVAKHVARYVVANFATVTQCAPVTDGCAGAYLDAFAEKAYRRPLDAAERSDLDARYEAARGTGAGTEDATGAVVTAILTAEPFLYRSEMGDASSPSAAPPGVPLTQYELASALSFFLTDGPPDQRLLDDARAGTLYANLGAQVDRVLATPAARSWLTSVMETLYLLNQLSTVIIDQSQFPIATPALYADLHTEAHLFLDDTLWNGNIVDLLASRTTFLNSYLAQDIYQVPIPAGATPTNFVKTTLPPDRSGILTNAGFLTTRSRTTGTSLIARGLAVNALFVCRQVPAPPANIILDERVPDGLTTHEQVAYRASKPLCASCHDIFDSYGVALEGFDIVGRPRTVGDDGAPVDTRAQLPPEVGGGIVKSPVELARAIGLHPAFKSCLATEMLEYATIDAPVELPNPNDGTPGCAAGEVLRRLDASGPATFSNLLRAVVLSPAFSLRSPAP